MKYLIAGLLALAATSADAARYLEIKFRVSGADVDVVMDTQSPDVSGFNLPPYSNPEYYEASLDSGYLYFLGYPNGYYDIFGQLDFTGYDLSASSFHYSLRKTGYWDATYLYGCDREECSADVYGTFYNVSVVGSDGPMTPSLTITGAIAGPPSAIPEMSTWAMMLGGFGLVGGALRSRRNKAVVRFG